jgi:hypothetical protein
MYDKCFRFAGTLVAFFMLGAAIAKVEDRAESGELLI